MNVHDYVLMHKLTLPSRQPLNDFPKRVVAQGYLVSEIVLRPGEFANCRATIVDFRVCPKNRELYSWLLPSYSGRGSRRGESE